VRLAGGAALLASLRLLFAVPGAAGQTDAEAKAEAGKAAALAPETAPNALYGRVVVSISYTSDGTVERSDLSRLLAIEAGNPLTESSTAQTVRNLFATRQFADVQIEVMAAGQGVAVRVVLLRAFRVSTIKFGGRRGLSREELRKVLPYFPGAVYSAEDVADGTSAIERRLLAEGFPNATVKAETEFDRRRFDAIVTYRIDAGERARVDPPILLGSLDPYSKEQLLSKTKLKVGQRYREAKASADAIRIREYLHAEGRLKAQVELIAAQPEAKSRIAPVYRVRVGPDVVIQATGVKEKAVRRALDELIEGQVFDEDLVLQYVEGEGRALQRKGYFRAKVDYKLDTQPDRVVVTIGVESGPRYAVERIVFDGNASVHDATLRKLMVVTPKGLPLVRTGKLTDADLKGDVDAILGYYQAHGWIAAKVGPADVQDGSRPGRLVVRIPIVEGVRTVVAKREIVGAEHGDTAAIDKLLAVKAGEPLNPNALRADVSAIQGYYQDRGWLEVAVRDEYVLSGDGASAEVSYRVTEGARSFFGKTIVRGNAATKTDRIRQLATWKEGAPFSEEKILQAQRQLSRSGAFRRVDVRPEPPDPSGRERNVEIEVQEARPLSLLYGFGYQYVPDAGENRNDPFVVGGVTNHNLFGGLRAAGIEGQIALSGRYRIQLSYRDPFLIGTDYPLTSVLFAARETIQNVDLERLGFVSEVAHTYWNYLRTSLRLEYQRIRPINPEDLSIIETEEFPRADQPIEEATIGPAFFYDRRDDVIDPHRGYYVSLAGKYAFPVFSAEARFTKFAMQGTWFQPIGRAVLVASGRFGGVFPYGNAPVPVPIAERFFVGGRSTGRGFETDLLGIPGGTLASLSNATVDYTTQARESAVPGQGNCQNTFPTLVNFDCNSGPRILGGNGFLSLSSELRFPIAGNLGGSVFYDAAQVWRSFAQMKLKFEGDDGLRQSVGIGLFYMLPIGPLRAEYSWKITRRTIPFEVVNVTDPQHPVVIPIEPMPTTRESAGQFFVSIGFPF
jgi:outer membrane protein assembly complex protein YaeT